MCAKFEVNLLRKNVQIQKIKNKKGMSNSPNQLKTTKTHAFDPKIDVTLSIFSFQYEGWHKMELLSKFESTSTSSY